MLDFEMLDPLSEGPSPQEQGFCDMGFPLLKRKGAENNEYYVYVDETEFKTVIADTVVLAIEKCEIAAPYKVIPAHRRIDDVVKNENLEFVRQEEESEVVSAAEAEIIVAEGVDAVAVETPAQEPPTEST